MNHYFNIQIAQKYGVDEAIIIENLYYWIAKNKANKKHFYDGNYWTYNSTKAFKELFPYWSERQIDRIIKSLKDQGAILTGNYNKAGYDRTRWFCLTMASTDIIPFGEMDLPKTSNAFTKNVEPIPNINTVIKPNINLIYTQDFEEFYKLYPNPFGKEQTFKNYKTLLKKETKENILKATKNYIQYLKEKNIDPQFITRSTNFIGQKQEYKGYLETGPTQPTIKSSNDFDFGGY